MPCKFCFSEKEAFFCVTKANCETLDHAKNISRLSVFEKRVEAEEHLEGLLRYRTFSELNSFTLVRICSYFDLCAIFIWDQYKCFY